MGFRFRRSVKLLPGVRLNFSARGVSTSLGGRGATVNISRRGTRATVGIPGTGLSYSAKLSGAARRRDPQAPADPDQAAPAGSPLIGLIVLGIALLALAMCVSSRSATPADPVRAAQPTAPAVATPSIRTVAGEGVNCRATPSKSGTVLAKLGKGETVTLTDTVPGWTHIARAGGDCWVADSLLAAA